MGSINPSVDLRRDGSIAVITIDNPPVNALKHEVRAGLVEAFARLREDSEVAAIVLACAGRTFSVGADITEFGTPAQGATPTLLDVIAAVDAMPKPVVAALHGTALGGGFELALGCQFRVAVPDARVGLPEIKLGLCPGAGGTQRLPRLVGPERALELILSGEALPAAAALAAGILDAVEPGGPAAAGIAFAREAIAQRRPARRVREREEALAEARTQPQGYDEAAARLTRRWRGQKAPATCVEAVRNAFTLPFEAGLARERALFMELLAGEQSAAQRHVFFAEREAAKMADLPPGTSPREVGRAAVIGGGTMGGGIAMCFANAGIPVTVIETDRAALETGLQRVAATYRTTVARGTLAAGEMERRKALIGGAVGLAAAAGADIVVEAVFEEMDLKKRVFAELDRIARPGALLATNTSYLDVDEIAQATGRPQDVVGMHFFSPANVMRLLEVVRGAASAPDAVATAMTLGRRLGKIPVAVGVGYGFVGNRMLAPRGVEAERLLLEGALPQEVDGALVDFGFPMGPFAMSDLAGLDVSWRMRKARGRRAEIADALCAAGHFGQKTGRGFYRYEAGSRTPTADPEVEALILAASRRLGIARRSVPREEILERLIFPTINEGARILAEGIAARPSDIDVIWVYGYGWPAWRGGPMFHADRVGLPYIRDRLALYAARSGDPGLAPAALLARLADEGQGFAALARRARP